MSVDAKKLTWAMSEPFKHVATALVRKNGDFWMVWRPDNQYQWYACRWIEAHHEFEVEKRDDGTWRPFENLHDAKVWCQYREEEQRKELPG